MADIKNFGIKGIASDVQLGKVVVDLNMIPATQDLT
jgi:hypothetical protein